MRVLDLFSGVGGFSLGLERAGMSTIAFCENDPFCRKVLAKHWPSVPIHKQIESLDGACYAGKVDLIAGGFPCQPFSVAGKQKGHQDDRHLWPEMLRVIGEARPTWVIGENVAGFIPMALDGVLADLEAEGYAGRAFVIPACAVDAPHRRDRCWIIARRVATDDDCAELRDEPGRRSGPDRQGSAESGDDGTQEPVANANGKGSQRRNGRVLQERTSEWAAGSGGTPVANAEGERCGQRRPNSGRGEERGRSEGSRSGSTGASGGEFGPSWLAEPDVGRVAHGVPDRVDRLKSLGNAVVPQVVEAIGRAILEEDLQIPGGGGRS